VKRYSFKKNNIMNNLIQYLKKVKDYRRKQGQKYPLWVIILIVIFGLMAGHTEYRALEAFGKSQQLIWLKYFQVKLDSMPSYSTIRRAMTGIDWAELIEIFNQWASELMADDTEINWFAIDGKCLRSTVQNCCENRQNFVSIISVFSQKNGLVLHLDKICNNETSELSKVQDIVRDIDCTNQVFTLDALHCQRATVTKIIAGGNNYLVAVKKNQRNLYKSLESHAKTTQPLQIYTTVDKSHSRHITRKVAVFEVPKDVQMNWMGSARFIEVNRSGTRGFKTYQQTMYYLTSQIETAKIFSEKIQGHWGIENKLHWVKDVLFHEDKSGHHQEGPATNFSVLSTIAINLWRLVGFSSITEGRRWLCNRFWLLPTLLA
jgi:predicted transposase YbfD/YdcC